MELHFSVCSSIWGYTLFYFMEGFMEILVILCGLGLLIGVIYLNVYIAKKFEAVANEKGFYGFFHILLS